MRYRFIICLIASTLLIKIAFGQQDREVDLRLAPSYHLQFANSALNATNNGFGDTEKSSLFEFDLCYTVTMDTGRFYRARIGHMVSDRVQTIVSDPTNYGNSREKLDETFFAFGIGRSFSGRFITIRMGLEYIFAWQPRHSYESSGYYLNRQGGQEKQVFTIKIPGEITSSLQIFANVYLKLGKRISTGIEFRQPLNLVFIRGDITTTQSTYNSRRELLTVEKGIQQLHETRLESAFVFSPLLGIRIRI